MIGLRVLVCGGRGYNDRDRVFAELDRVDKKIGFISIVIEGGATGADRLARGWAIERGRDTETHSADWKQHGQAAGPIRNQSMVDEGFANLVVAFPGGKGTADLCRRARKAGIEVIEVKL